MDVEELPCKFSRISKMADQYPENEDEDEDGASKIRKIGNNIVSTTDNEENGGGLISSRLRGWHNSSRIFRVSRASGGKDRHSKVLTSKGLRDRRVRLSVSTAISFYDLQDRLGYDQPSKAVEWLIKAADEAINELPSLNTPFSDMPLKQFSSARGENVGGVEHDYRNYQQQISACSSTSETSKGSGLSVSRSDANVRVNREKARERARARERASKEKESETHLPNHNSSFTELLSAGISKQNSGGGDGLSLFSKSEKQWQPPSMDYFTTGLLSSSRNSNHSNLGFASGQIQLGNNSNFPQSMMMIPPFSVAGENQNPHQNPPELQHFSFMPPNNGGGGGGGGGNENYNLNFTISPSSTTSSGFNNNRGTLQSNSSVPSSMLPHHHLQRFSSSIDGSSSNVVPFFMGAATSAHSSVSAAGHLESTNHPHYHQFGAGFDGSLQLYHGDGTRDSDHKGKGKN